MNATTVFRTLGPIDLRGIRRDSFLAWAIFLPLPLGALLRWGLPAITDWLARDFAFDLTPYHTLAVSYFVALMVPLLIGQVIGFLLLDERDDDTLHALLVTPLPIAGYIAYRIGVPLVLSSGVAALVIAGSGLVDVAWYQLAPIALLYALETPIMTLSLASLCENKVQGFAFAKGIGGVPLIAGAAYFLDAPWQYLAGILPTYWPLLAFWIASQGAPGFWLAFTVGLAVHVALLAWLLKRFHKTVHA